MSSGFRFLSEKPPVINVEQVSHLVIKCARLSPILLLLQPHAY